MGKIKNLVIRIMELAEQTGDPYGFEDETVDYIASELQISVDEVRAALDMNSSVEQSEYAEMAADLDAEHYGRV